MFEEKLCADCYWDKDAEIKKQLRMNPVWIFQRAYSAAIVIYGLSHEKAVELAGLAVKNMGSYN
jgi:hypothetical protein